MNISQMAEECNRVFEHVCKTHGCVDVENLSVGVMNADCLQIVGGDLSVSLCNFLDGQESEKSAINTISERFIYPAIYALYWNFRNNKDDTQDCRQKNKSAVKNLYR